MKNSDNNSTKATLRQKAEGLLKTNEPNSNSQLTESETLKLIHELQVHQIELELQNEELIQAKEQAELDTEKYIELYDFAPSGYFTLSSNAEIIELNFVAAKMLGKERSHLKNKHFALFLANGSKQIFHFFLDSIFQTNTIQTCEINLTTNTQLPNYIYLSGIAKENENHCLVTAVDITQRKQMEIELVHEKEHAQESDRLKTAFLQNMSHEIRTPLHAIKGFSQLLVREHCNELKIDKYTKIIDQRSDDLLDIINDILDISKIESGQLPIYLEECSLTVLFAELTYQFNEYQVRNGKQHIKFSFQTVYDPSGSVIVTDKGKLKQIFVNLLTNAFKFTNDGAIEGGCKFENNNLIFYVSDTGVGIPADKQNIVFERFFQLKQSENQALGGTGLGLSIIKGLVSLLGGKIFLDSKPGKGSTFSFTFPYKIAQPLHKVPLEEEETTAGNFTNKTILLVEDEECNVILLKELLVDTGLNIVVAETGIEAIQFAASQAFDLVLMDIRLPDMDGYQAANHIKQLNPTLKIIAQTAYATLNDKQKAIDAGFNDYISKPIKVELLLTLLNKYLTKG
jgi:signal transduction histidine kinase